MVARPNMHEWHDGETEADEMMAAIFVLQLLVCFVWWLMKETLQRMKMV